MGDLLPPDPPLAGAQTALRPFRVSDAAAISESCRDPDIPRFTMMPEAMTEDQARQWVERSLVQLVTHLDNERSQRVAERCGFSREGVLRAWEPVKDEQPDVVMWSRLVNDPSPDLGRS